MRETNTQKLSYNISAMFAWVEVVKEKVVFMKAGTEVGRPKPRHRASLGGKAQPAAPLITLTCARNTAGTILTSYLTLSSPPRCGVSVCVCCLHVGIRGAEIERSRHDTT